ncbi:MAG: hypothetical protein RLZZ337_1780 [Bacteroidota bacterium]|jgi:4-hydroxybenzoate polyprenyltransferase
MLNYLKIYRPINILFIALAQWLAAYFLDFSASFQSIKEGGIYWLMLGTASCAAFGYWVNDFLDQERDAINKIGQRTISSINKMWSYVHFLIFILIALFAGFMLSTYFLVVFAAVILLLVLYSTVLKDVAGLGNILIGLLSFLSIYLIIKLFPDADALLIIHFALLAGMINLCREIIKDAEDLEGDQATNGRSLPIVFGLRYTNLAVYIILLFTLSFLVVSLYYQSNFLTTPLRYLYYTYQLLFVIVPLYKVAIDVRFAEHKAHYTSLSKWLKYVIFTGILSILFF